VFGTLRDGDSSRVGNLRDGGAVVLLLLAAVVKIWASCLSTFIWSSPIWAKEAEFWSA
jgi:hypothetical protein